MQVISDFCERFKAFFTRKPKLVLPIIDDSKVIEENTDLEFRIPPTPTELEAMSPLGVEMPLEVPTLSVPAQMPTALEFLAQQRLAYTAKDTDTPHSDEDTNEEKQDVAAPVVTHPQQNDMD